VQEGINNILKHAGATDATVTLGVVDSTVRLTIKDNGRGFTREPGNVPGGFGLVGISERARVLGGTATVESAAGSGTTLVVVIPVTRQVT
jgi:signal transduction histidine kinase